MRPTHWSKNVIVLVGPAVFVRLLTASSLITLFLVVVAFSIVSGISYIINDLFDRSADKFHPLKAARPIASGDLEMRHAILFVVVSGALILSLLAYFSPITAAFASVLPLNVTLYSWHGSKYPVLDVLHLAFDDVSRFLAGILVVGLPFSLPFTISIFLVSAMLTIGRRRCDANLLGENAGKFKESLAWYDGPQAAKFQTVATTLALISFSAFVFGRFQGYRSAVFIAIAGYILIRHYYLTERHADVVLQSHLLFRDVQFSAGLVAYVVTSLFL